MRGSLRADMVRTEMRRRHRVVAARVEGMTAPEAPRGEITAAQHAEALDRRERALIEPERFANDAAQAVARDRAARGAYRHRESETRRSQIVGSHNHRE